jgi:hypothetical protein
MTVALRLTNAGFLECTLGKEETLDAREAFIQNQFMA